MLDKRVQHRYLALLIPTLTLQYKSGWQQQHHLFEVIFAKSAELYSGPCYGDGIGTLRSTLGAEAFSLLIPNILWHELAGSGSWGLAQVSRSIGWALVCLQSWPTLLSTVRWTKEKVQVILSVIQKCYSICSNVEYVSKWPWTHTQIKALSSSVVFSDTSPLYDFICKCTSCKCDTQWIQVISSLPLSAEKRLLLCSPAHTFLHAPLCACGIYSS